MSKKILVIAAAIACSGFFVLAEQPTVFTAAQAAAGKTAFENTCGKCHTYALTGRKGEPGETPELSSIPAAMQKFVKDAGGKIPPLAGPDFMARWGGKTTQDFSARVKIAFSGFPPENSDEETYLKLTAYILQVSGAHSGTHELTATTSVMIDEATASSSPHLH